MNRHRINISYRQLFGKVHMKRMSRQKTSLESKDLLSPEYLRHIVIDFMQMSEFVKEPLVMSRADGVWYEDVQGKKYLDGLSGIFVVNVGHNNRRVIDAIKEQLDRMAFAPPLYSTNPRALELANLISKITPGDLRTVKLFSGGSEATEAALKLARQFHRQSGNPNKFKVISRYESYHGATMGSLSATGVKRRKVMFEPLLTGFIHIFPPKCFRCPYGLEYPSCKILCARILGDVIEMEGAESVAAFIVEPIGNTGGIITPKDEYFKIIREICDKFNVLLIFDEVLTGFGRTGQMFAAQTFNTTPDILCMGKGISSGYAPLAAIAFSDRIEKAFWGPAESNIEFSHGHTYGGNPIAAAAGIACINEILERDLCDNARKMGKYLWEKLEALEHLKVIGEIRGKGLLIGVEFVKDLESKEPFGADVNFGIRVGRTALKKGLIIRFDPNWIALAPPLIIVEDEIDRIVAILEESIKEVIRNL
jgi:adenosylmethionine-8-amino-7-oxononanoate aminotransferase